MFLLWKVAAATLAAVLTLYGQAQTARIIGGHEAGKHSRPYMVLLQYINETNHTVYCGGFLVSADFVLTAAHCKGRSYVVYLGFHDYYDQNGVQRVSVEADIPHQNYSAKKHINDIMILKLQSSANISNDVKPVALADKKSVPPKLCSVAGWGQTTRKNDLMSLKLMEANVELIENKKCDEKRTYCSGGKAGPGKGDSGGPLVCEDGTVHGVVAVEFQPKWHGRPVFMYTKIADNRDWIDRVMKNIRTL